LGYPSSPRSEIKMEIYDVDAGRSHLEPGVHESFFAQVAISERGYGAIGYWILRKKGIAIAERLAPVSRVVDSVFCVRISAFLLNMLQEIDMPIPVGRLVYLLECDDVRGVAFDKPGDFLKILSNAARSVKSLIERKPSPMRDVEAHYAERL